MYGSDVKSVFEAASGLRLIDWRVVRLPGEKLDRLDIAAMNADGNVVSLGQKFNPDTNNVENVAAWLGRSHASAPTYIQTSTEAAVPPVATEEPSQSPPSYSDDGMKIKGLGESLARVRGSIASARIATQSLDSATVAFIADVKELEEQIKKHHEDLKFEADTLRNEGA